MAVIRIPAEDDFGKPTWPEKFPREELDLRRQALGDLRYAQEYLVTPTPLYGAELPLEWLTLYDYERCMQDGLITQDYYYGVDPSITGTGDYMAICIVAKGTEDKRNYLIDFVREKAKMDRMVELLERTALIYPPRMVVVEAIAAQQLFVQELSTKTELPIWPYLPKGKKEDRIATMAHVFFSTGKVLVRGRRDEYLGIVFDERMNYFKQEWLGFPRGTHDDTLDAAEACLTEGISTGGAVSLSSDAVIEAYRNQEHKEEAEPQVDDDEDLVPMWARRASRWL